jgi:hypothetical protein
MRGTGFALLNTVGFRAHGGKGCIDEGWLVQGRSRVSIAGDRLSVAPNYRDTFGVAPLFVSAPFRNALLL